MVHAFNVICSTFRLCRPTLFLIMTILFCPVIQLYHWNGVIMPLDFHVISSRLGHCPFQTSHLMRGCVAGTTSISAISPVQLVCCGKSTLTSLPFGLIDTTVPTLPWFTDPHLYLGVVTEALTRTRSPTLISSRRAAKEQK